MLNQSFSVTFDKFKQLVSSTFELKPCFANATLIQGGAPTSYKWSYNPYKWPYTLGLPGVITLLIGVIRPI